jgi:uracil-DNA glycosylase family 4
LKPAPPPTSPLREITDQIARCKRCKLGTPSARAVPGEGNPETKMMFVGEAPGFYEDQQGKPFVGPAGKFLDELLKLAGVTRKDVFITNVVKHRPPANRDPEPDELEACDGFLRAQIAIIKPQVIVTLGRFSLGKFVPNVRAMRDIHGRAMPYEGMTVVAMYHPAAALHQASLRSVLEEDFRNLPTILARASRPQAPTTTAPTPAPQPEEPTAEQMSLW